MTMITDDNDLSIISVTLLITIKVIEVPKTVQAFNVTLSMLLYDNHNLFPH